MFKKTYEIQATEEELLAIEAVFCQINRLASIGSSRDILISVDGDGSARMRILSDGEDVVFSDETLKAIYDAEAKETFSLGVKDLGVVAEIEKDGNMKTWIGE